MERNCHRLLTGLLAAAILAVPVIAASQPPTQPPPVTQPPAEVRPAAQPPATPAEPPAQTAAPQKPTDGGALVLLSRIEEIIDQSLGHSPAAKTETKGTPGAKGTSGVTPGVAPRSSAGRVSVDRAALDEIRAEVEQLKIMLQPKAVKQ